MRLPQLVSQPFRRSRCAPSCRGQLSSLRSGPRRSQEIELCNFHAHDSRAEPQAERSREVQKLAAFFKLSIYQTYTTPP